MSIEMALYKWMPYPCGKQSHTVTDWHKVIHNKNQHEETTTGNNGQIQHGWACIFLSHRRTRHHISWVHRQSLKEHLDNNSLGVQIKKPSFTLSHSYHFVGKHRMSFILQHSGRIRFQGQTRSPSNFWNFYWIDRFNHCEERRWPLNL